LLPIAVLVGAVATPGHVAAPFEWQMALQVLQCVFAGVPFYFAGMVCALRPVRWYASRLLPLGIGLATAAAASQPPFASEMIWVWPVMGLLITIAATTAWACFRSDGAFETQSRTGKFASVVTLLTGTTAVCLFVGLLSQMFSSHENAGWSYYTITKDGTIYKVTRMAGEPQKVYDLQGNLIKEPGTDKPIEDQQFNKRISFGPATHADFFDDRKGRREQFFTAWIQQRRDLWYWTRNGTLQGYNVVTREKIGAISAPQPFRQPLEPWLTTYQSRRTLSSSDALYLIDYGKLTATNIWSCSEDERIVGTSEMQYMSDGDSEARGYVMILTPRRVVLVLRDEGKTVLELPMKIGPADHVALHFLRDHKFSLWLTPPRHDGKQGPTHITWIADNGSISREMDLPQIERASPIGFGDRVLAALVPPVMSIPAAVLAQTDNDFPFSRSTALVSILLGILCAAIAMLRLRRYSFSTGAQVVWTIATLLLGIPCLLTLLCLYEWPARVSCLQCGKLRVVTNDQCEHCAAEFAPPSKAGVEIFAPLVKV
ncbi:MAG: hypothetical protein ACXWBP_12220, partial [Limisphaerales bacterium]